MTSIAVEAGKAGEKTNERLEANRDCSEGRDGYSEAILHLPYHGTSPRMGSAMSRVVGRNSVIRISLGYIYTFSKNIEPIFSLPDGDTKLVDLMVPLWIAKDAVENMHNHSVFAPYLNVSRQPSVNFISAINSMLNNFEDNTKIVVGYNIVALKRECESYKSALLAELGIFNSYFVTYKLPFDVTALLMAGESLFPMDINSKVPEAIIDAREAGKCLAYEAPTAAGFHLFRVLESVLRRYYAYVTGGVAAPKQRNIGVYINAMKQAKKGDEKILSTIKQISDHHRNPLAHPEAVLSTDEAIATAGIVRSAVTLMLSVLPTPLQTTTSPSVLPSP